MTFLTSKNRRALLAGERPTLTWPADQAPPVGTIEAVTKPHRLGDPASADFHIEIIALRPITGKAHLRADYRLVDLRAVNLPRRTPPAHRVKRGADDAVQPPSAADIEKAAHESAYTSVPHLALVDEPEHPDRDDKHLKRANAAVKARDVERMAEIRAERAELQARKDARRLGEQAVRLMVRRARAGLPNDEFLLALEQVLRRAEPDERKAA